jgi:hypothetical protein
MVRDPRLSHQIVQCLHGKVKKVFENLPETDPAEGRMSGWGHASFKKGETHRHAFAPHIDLKTTYFNNKLYRGDLQTFSLF